MHDFDIKINLEEFICEKGVLSKPGQFIIYDRKLPWFRRTFFQSVSPFFFSHMREIVIASKVINLDYCARGIIEESASQLKPNKV